MIINIKPILKHVKLTKKTFLLVVTGAILGALFLSYAFDNIYYRLVNIVDVSRGTIGSGRDVLWGTYFDYWRSSDLINALFGHGFYSTMSIFYGFIAHNDSVQFLLDFGLLGLILFYSFLARMYLDIRLVKRYDTFLSVLLAICWLILIGRGLISGTIRTDNINWAISFGYLMGVASLKAVAYERKS